MTAIRIEPILRQVTAVHDELLEINNLHAVETSPLTEEAWRALVERACYATCMRISGDAALLIALDQDADYDNANFNWFKKRYSRFVYVDRIVVSKPLQGLGIAALMYLDLFRYTQNAHQDFVGCEVNEMPPNPRSDKFHAKMGFSEVGRARLEHNGKTVRYLVKEVG